MDFAEYLEKFETTTTNCTMLGFNYKKYYVSQEHLLSFLQKYHNYVIINKEESHLIELQIDGGPIIIDLDFKHPLGTLRQFDNKTKDNLVECIILSLNQLYCIDKDYFIWFMERQLPYDDNNITKDGIHIFIGINSTKEERINFRIEFLRQLKNADVFKSMNLLNSVEGIVDFSVSRSSTGMTLLGSNKVDKQRYQLTQTYNVSNSYEFEDWTEEDFNVANFEDFFKLSAKYPYHPRFHVITAPVTAPALNSIPTNEPFNLDLYRICDNATDAIPEIYQHSPSQDRDFHPAFNYNKWLSALFAIKNVYPCEKGCQLFLKFSRKSKIHDDPRFNTQQEMNYLKGLRDKWESETPRDTDNAPITILTDWADFYRKPNNNVADIDITEKTLQYTTEQLKEMMRKTKDQQKQEKLKVQNQTLIEKELRQQQKISEMKLRQQQKMSEMELRQQMKNEDSNCLDDPEYIEWKSNFNWVKIRHRSLFMRKTIDKTVFLKEKDIIVAYKNESYTKYLCNNEPKRISLINEWLKDEEMRVYDDIEVFPPPLICPDNIYNIWEPFYAETLPSVELTKSLEEDRDFILKHIYILCNHNEDDYNWLCRWIGQMLKHPTIKSFCPTLICRQGGGKGAFVKMLTNLLGYKKVFETTTPDRDVWGNFNSQMADCFLVFCDELDKKQQENSGGKIKGLITNPNLTINCKGIDPFKIMSYHRFINASNGSIPIYTDDDDLRNKIIRGNDELSANVMNETDRTEYFNKFHKIIDLDTILKSLYDYFVGLKSLNTFHLEQIKQNDYQKAISVSNRPIPLIFLEDLTRNYCFSKNQNREFSGKDLFEIFNVWKTEHGYKYDTDSAKLLRNLQLLQIPKWYDKKKTEKCNLTIVDFDFLKKYFNVGVENIPL